MSIHTDQIVNAVYEEAVIQQQILELLGTERPAWKREFKICLRSKIMQGVHHLRVWFSQMRSFTKHRCAINYQLLSATVDPERNKMVLQVYHFGEIPEPPDSIASEHDLILYLEVVSLREKQARETKALSYKPAHGGYPTS